MLGNEKPRHPGFTLIEVIVALGIAAGALILLVGANHQSMRRSIRARQAVRLGQRIESKLDEIRCGALSASHGELDGLPGWTWMRRKTRARAAGLPGLERLELRVFRPGAFAEPVRTVAVLQYNIRKQTP